MRKRVLLSLGVATLLVLVALVVWQVSFNLDEYGPADIGQTFIFWAVSTLVFVLTMVLGFILFRTGLRLYLERHKDLEGSRIRSKLFFGAFALSFLPVCFLVVFSYALLNRNLEKWFARPGEQLKIDYIAVAKAIDGQMKDKLSLTARLLGQRPELTQIIDGKPAPRFLELFAKEYGLAAIEIRELNPENAVIGRYGSRDALARPPRGVSLWSQTVTSGDGRQFGLALAMETPLDLAATEARISRYLAEIGKLDAEKKWLRSFYILMQALIALFVLFLSTWIALFLAKQISNPISALLKAADEVGEGNFHYRVDVRAIDELGRLVRGFNAMTSQLESNSRELDARRRFTEAILESIPTGVLSLSRDGTIQRVNRALKQIFPEEQVARAQRLEDLFSREDSAEMRYLMKRARRTGLASREFDLNTGRQTLHISATVAALDDKVTSGFVLVLEDLSDLLRAQKAAAWNEVARRIAHEIKNPLTPIALSAERISRQADRLAARPDAASALEDLRRIATECAATISTEVESVKRLVDEFARFARFPAAKPVRADLNEVVESAISIFDGRLEDVKVRVDLTPGLPAVALDREQFKRVVVNLVDNAAEAMHDSPLKELRVATLLEGPGVVALMVTDTGCGVSADDKEKLFLPYFSTKGRGTGLGLAIVNHILSEHGATIRVEDNKPSGASFLIEIPALLDGEGDSPAEAADPALVKHA
ncbi:MAG: ATP-binding protein [Bryobacteraceae bacterium]